VWRSGESYLNKSRDSRAKDSILVHLREIRTLIQSSCLLCLVYRVKTVMIFKNNRQIRLPNGLQIRYVSRSDAKFLTNEILTRKTYFPPAISQLLHSTSTDRPRRIIDVGSNIGLFSIGAAQELVSQDALIIAIEPIPDIFNVLKHNIDSYQTWTMHNSSTSGEAIDTSSLPPPPPPSSSAPTTKPTSTTIIPVNCGIGDGSIPETEFTFYKCAAGWSTMLPDSSGTIQHDMTIFLKRAVVDGGLESSLDAGISAWQYYILKLSYTIFPSLFQLVQTAAVNVLLSRKAVVRCQLKTVSDLMKEYAIEDGVDLLKIDCERAEIDVLRGVQPHHWQCIRSVVMECHEEAVESVTELLRRYYNHVDVGQDAALLGTSLYNITSYSIK